MCPGGWLGGSDSDNKRGLIQLTFNSQLELSLAILSLAVHKHQYYWLWLLSFPQVQTPFTHTHTAIIRVHTLEILSCPFAQFNKRFSDIFTQICKYLHDHVLLLTCYLCVRLLGPISCIETSLSWAGVWFWLRGNVQKNEFKDIIQIEVDLPTLFLTNLFLTEFWSCWPPSLPLNFWQKSWSFRLWNLHYPLSLLLFRFS